MDKVQNYCDLDAWKRAHGLTVEIYRVTKKFPKTEIFGLIDQARRAASSVGANIAEGFGRYHFKDKNKFYYQARGSLFEVQNHLLLSKDLNFLSQAEFNAFFVDTENLARLINGLIRSMAVNGKNQNGS